MRLFTGIALPKDIVGNLTRVVEHLRTTAHVKWSPPYNLHITTKFIGEWPEERLDELTAALKPLSGSGAFDVNIRGFRWLPNPHNPRILFVGVHAPDMLQKLAADTDAALRMLGIAAEERAFKPHMTIARIKDSVPLHALRRAIADLKSDDFGAFKADRFHLYLSTPGPASSIYTQLAEFPLTVR
jgi:RNA 2',3'-cyclic 3'-phosphodiesterase